MFAWLRNFGGIDSLSPHGICLLWQPELIWTHAISDAVIALAYFSIPLALGHFLLKRRDVALSGLYWAFAVFILACGTTHLFAIWTLWVPDYGAEALVKVVTALASIITAYALWHIMPLALSLPSPAQLREANEALRLRVAERDAALEALRDAIAERLRTEELLHHARKMEAVGQLTGGVAHDFNNMLNIVIGNIERMQRRVPADDPMQAWIQNAMTGAERAAAVTHKLLAFARRQPLQPAITDVGALVAEVVELLHNSVGDRIVVATEVAPGLPAIAVDRGQFENALLNLAFNARDAMPEGGRLTLSAAPSASGREVVVAVRDDGHGMDAETAERAFEPFFTTKPVGHGTGLGLSQVFGFAQQTGGRAEIESAPGRGTTIRLVFPVARPTAAPEPCAPGRRSPDPGPSGFGLATA